ncbi:hypothetical protein LY76DRAFT_644598 [Colletotrichum caudatum]|nr:hypothetical protein LY76DRAFT_644598 [Colletotrichum caudatum]
MRVSTCASALYGFYFCFCSCFDRYYLLSLSLSLAIRVWSASSSALRPKTRPLSHDTSRVRSLRTSAQWPQQPQVRSMSTTANSIPTCCLAADPKQNVSKAAMSIEHLSK